MTRQVSSSLSGPLGSPLHPVLRLLTSAHFGAQRKQESLCVLSAVGHGLTLIQVVRERFGEVVEEAAAGALDQWRHGYEALAGVIVRDQFTRS